MNVCFINLSIEPYPPVDTQAISTCIQQTARELTVAGHSVTIVSRSSGGSLNEGEMVTIPPASHEDGGLVSKLRHLRSAVRGLDWPGQREYLRGVRSAVRRLPTPPDLFVVANDFHVPQMLKRLDPHTPVILWLHNEQRTNHREPATALRAVDCVAAVSGYLRRWIVHNLPVADHQVAVVHNGVNFERFHPAAKFPTSCQPARILFVGRLDEGKGPDVLLSAAAELAEEGLPASITLVGGRQRFRETEARADAYVENVLTNLDQLEGRFLASVTRSHLPELMRQHDIVCVPSRVNEAFSLVALEAMASGCAVVASDRGGLPEACGGAAVHFDPDDGPGVREALGALLRDPDLMRSYKERALLHAQTKSWASTAHGMLAAVGANP